jgi:hypothetical protein
LGKKKEMGSSMGLSIASAVVILLLGLSPYTAAAQATGSYHLPVDPSYQDVNSFHLPELQWINSESGHARVFYKLPEDLIGRDEGMVMVSLDPLQHDDRFFPLHCFATDSDAMCTRSENGKISCAIRFRNVPVDAAIVETFLTNKYGTDDPLLPQRKAAMRAFAADPVGTLQITPSDL